MVVVKVVSDLFLIKKCGLPPHASTGNEHIANCFILKVPRRLYCAPGTAQVV